MRKLARWFRYNLAYFRRPPWDTGISPPELLQFIATHPPGRALDLGCGTGLNCLTLAKAGWQVTGVEFVPRAVQKARRRMKSAGQQAHIRLGDVTRLDDLPGGYDLILDIGCLHALGAEGKQRYAAQLPRLLAPGGSFLLYAHLDQSGEERNIGLLETDIDRLAGLLNLCWRQDGQDGPDRAAVWLCFQQSER